MNATAAPQPPRMSWEEFLEWADEDTYAEWVDGEVVCMSPASRRHQRIARFLTASLQAYAEEHQIGEVMPAPFPMRLGRSGREPDLLFVARQHLDRLQPTHLSGPADLAVEIVSPESRTRDRRDKLREYEREGVREYWLIDPERNQAQFYLLDASGTYRESAVENGVFHSAVLAGLWLRVDWLWQEPLPPLLSVLREWGLI